jgi:hypothetical protein
MKKQVVAIKQKVGECIYTYCICGNIRTARRILSELREECLDNPGCVNVRNGKDQFWYDNLFEGGNITVFISEDTLMNSIRTYRESGRMFQWAG